MSPRNLISFHPKMVYQTYLAQEKSCTTKNWTMQNIAAYLNFCMCLHIISHCHWTAKHQEPLTRLLVFMDQMSQTIFAQQHPVRQSISLLCAMAPEAYKFSEYPFSSIINRISRESSIRILGLRLFSATERMLSEIPPMRQGVRSLVSKILRLFSERMKCYASWFRIRRYWLS